MHWDIFALFFKHLLIFLLMNNWTFNKILSIFKYDKEIETNYITKQNIY